MSCPFLPVSTCRRCPLVPSHCASSAFVQIGTKSRLVNCTFSFTQRITLYWDLDSRETQQWNHPSCRNNHVGKVTLERTSRREWHQECHPMLVSQAICANEAGSFHRAERGRPQKPQKLMEDTMASSPHPSSYHPERYSALLNSRSNLFILFIGSHTNTRTMRWG